MATRKKRVQKTTLELAKLELEKLPADVLISALHIIPLLNNGNHLAALEKIQKLASLQKSMAEFSNAEADLHGVNSKRIPEHLFHMEPRGTRADLNTENLR
jgi:hypothetical protein